MANARLYGFWGDLTEALKTGKPQNEIKHTGKPMFEELYSDEAARAVHERDGGDLRGPLHGARGEVRLLEVRDALRRRRRDRSALDHRRQPHPHMRCTSFDLPVVEPIAEAHIEAAGLSDRVKAVGWRLLRRPAAQGGRDHDGDDPPRLEPREEEASHRSAYDALPEGGAFIAIENIIDDARRENAFGLLMSLNMLIEFGDAFDYTGATSPAGAKRPGSKRQRSCRSPARRAQPSRTSSAVITGPGSVSLRAKAGTPLVPVEHCESVTSAGAIAYGANGTPRFIGRPSPGVFPPTPVPQGRLPDLKVP